MTAADTPSATVPPIDEDTSRPQCAACAHDMTAHDPIGVRFCAATTAGALSRGCVCTGVTAASATRWPTPR